tara:strand:+ start:1753 stop:1962 length:210 start_codon:yes stop_codon:yes gene_type:complete
MHKFVIREGSELITYSNFEDIPNEFDHIISFEPKVPEPPHTEEQHKEIEQWQGRLQELIQRERRNASSN